MVTTSPESLRVEISVLEKMGVRWAALAAWREDLLDRGVALVADPAPLLETTRAKISSGCFSSCEVGCDLADVERTLTSADASSAPSSVDEWLDVLGRCMSEDVDTEALLAIPAVKFQYARCGLIPCKCGT